MWLREFKSRKKRVIQVLSSPSVYTRMFPCQWSTKRKRNEKSSKNHSPKSSIRRSRHSTYILPGTPKCSNPSSPSRVRPKKWKTKEEKRRKNMIDLSNKPTSNTWVVLWLPRGSRHICARRHAAQFGSTKSRSIFLGISSALSRNCTLKPMLACHCIVSRLATTLSKPRCNSMGVWQILTAMWQWNNQAPGLSFRNATISQPLPGNIVASRRVGLSKVILAESLAGSNRSGRSWGSVGTSGAGDLLELEGQKGREREDVVLSQETRLRTIAGKS